jgi:transcription antitermination factor NusG
MSWFAVMTHPKREIASTQEIRSLGLGAFYPWTKVRRNRRRGRQVITEWIGEPYYPRYVFADCRLDDIHKINANRYVSRVVQFGEKPSVIPEAVMQVIMAGARADGLMGSKDEVARARFQAAERVQFVAGTPMAGVIARIIADDGQRDVSVLVMGLMGADRELRVPVSSIERAA